MQVYKHAFMAVYICMYDNVLYWGPAHTLFVIDASINVETQTRPCLTLGGTESGLCHAMYY